MTRVPAHHLHLRPLACGSLAAVVTPEGAVLTVLSMIDALALLRSLTHCTPAERSEGNMHAFHHAHDDVAA